MIERFRLATRRWLPRTLLPARVGGKPRRQRHAQISSVEGRYLAVRRDLDAALEALSPEATRSAS